MDIRNIINQITHSQNFKHGILYTGFSFANNGISFILLLILAHYLLPSDYGSLNLFNTFVTLLNIIISLCTTAYVSVAYFQVDKITLRKIIIVGLGTTTMVLLLLSILLSFGVSFVEQIVGIDIQYLWLGLFICYFQVFTNMNLEIWRLEEKPISYGLFSMSMAILNFGLTLWLIVGIHMNWEGRVYSQWLVATIFFIISIIFLIKRRYLILTKPTLAIFKDTYLYALPLIPHMVSFWLRQGMDRYIINYFHDQAAVGYFSFAMNLAAIITMVGNAFNSTNSVYIYKKLAEGYAQARGVLSRQTKIMTAVFLAVSIAVGLFAFGLIHFFIPRYEGSIRYILPLCFGGFFQCIYLLWVNYLFYYKKTRQLMHITLSTALLQVLLSLWLTPYSPLFTAYISMAITLLTMILVIFRSKRYFNKEAK